MGGERNGMGCMHWMYAGVDVSDLINPAAQGSAQLCFSDHPILGGDTCKVLHPCVPEAAASELL